MSDYRPDFIREAEEWEVIGFCPNCKISMMFFEVDYERSWVHGRVCPKCQFVYEGHGIDDGKLLKIRIFHGVQFEDGGG